MAELKSCLTSINHQSQRPREDLATSINKTSFQNVYKPFPKKKKKITQNYSIKHSLNLEPILFWLYIESDHPTVDRNWTETLPIPWRCQCPVDTQPIDQYSIITTQQNGITWKAVYVTLFWFLVVETLVLQANFYRWQKDNNTGIFSMARLSPL